MSTEVAHKIEEPVAPAIVEPTSTVESTPAIESTPATEATPDVTEPVAAAEESKPVEEVKPVEEGVLGYKGPGLLKSLFPSKKFFWFGTEPVEAKSLSSYLRGEKAQDAASKNVAWAAHTGKGLLFFSKKATDKASPAGLFNLSEVSDITEEHSAFAFTYGGHKHTFETPSVAERDNWVAVLKSKTAEATELAPTVAESEEYKKYLNPTPVVAAAAPVVAPVAPVEEPAATETPIISEPVKENVVDEKKSRTKSRSASRKRNSIFGGFGKKEEKTELPKEVPAVDEPVVNGESSEVATEPIAATEAPAVVEPTEVSAPAVEEAAAARPTPSKRNSIFGTLQSRFSSKTEKKTPESPIIAREDLVATSDTAPIIPAVGTVAEPTGSIDGPTEVPAEATESPTTPATKEKRKSSLPFGLGKKLTMKKEKSEKQALAEETPAETPAVAEEKAIETPSEAPVIADPTPIQTTTPQVTTSA